jgi:hypothetical protein
MKAITTDTNPLEALTLTAARLVSQGVSLPSAFARVLSSMKESHPDLLARTYGEIDQSAAFARYLERHPDLARVVGEFRP